MQSLSVAHSTAVPGWAPQAVAVMHVVEKPSRDRQQASPLPHEGVSRHEKLAPP